MERVDMISFQLCNDLVPTPPKTIVQYITSVLFDNQKYLQERRAQPLHRHAARITIPYLLSRFGSLVVSRRQ